MSKSSDETISSFGYCIECGKPLEKGAKFCIHCGHPVSPVAQESHEANERDVVEDAAEPANMPVSDAVDSDVNGDTDRDVDGDVSAESKDNGSEDDSAKTEHAEDPEKTGEFSYDAGETSQIPLSEVVAAERSTEETREIPVVPQPTVPQYSSVMPDSTAPMPAVGAAGIPPQETFNPTSQQPVSYSADNTAKPKRDTKKIAIIIAIVAVVVIAVVAAFLLFGNNNNNATNSVVVDNTENTPTQIVVELTDTYTTSFPDENAITYPTFSFKYPASWDVTDESVTTRGETVELTNSTDGTVITYSQRTQGSGSSNSVSFSNAEKMADSAFVPTGVQGTDYSDLGQFIVAKGDLVINGSNHGTCYALVPSSALSGSTDLDLRAGVPGFWYASSLSFVCQPSEELSAQTEQEVIAILASFTESEAVSSSSTVVNSTDDYMLPESNTRTYSESELSSLSNYELYIARNEIFARHGRTFNNADLQSYFGSKSWYSGTVSPDAFDDSVLNQYEKANIEAISKIENDRGSSYVS